MDLHGLLQRNFDFLEQRRLVGCYAVTLVRNVVSEERIASVTRIKRIGELGTTLAVTRNSSKKYFFAAFFSCQLVLPLFLAR
jgi:hypothetical protein